VVIVDLLNDECMSASWKLGLTWLLDARTASAPC
jgi:hypothetical protein